jgi:hypothetical protein
MQRQSPQLKGTLAPASLWTLLASGASSVVGQVPKILACAADGRIVEEPYAESFQSLRARNIISVP